MTDETIREVEQFLYREARLLDERRFHEWLDLLTDDVRYRMATRGNHYPRSSKAIAILDATRYVEEDVEGTNSRSSTKTRRVWLAVSPVSTPAWPGPRTRRRAPGI
jgi:3-phenylpropionate/cinnamic acid dioxygenase small subunit